MSKRLVPGQRLIYLPGNSLNKAISAGDRMQEFVAPGGPQPANGLTDSPRNVVLVKNMTGMDLIERAIVGIKETALDLPDIDDEVEDGNLADFAVLTGEAVDVEKPDPAKHTAGRWGVTLGPIKDEETGWMAIGGLIKCRVDVTNASHQFGKLILNETEHLASDAVGVPITWKKIGTGKKWAQVNLSTAETGNVIYAQVNEATGVATGDATFSFDNAVAEVGIIPTDGEGTAQNQYGQEYADNEWVHLFQRKDNGQWITERGGTAGSLVKRFRTTAAKEWDTPQCDAVLLDADDDPVGDPIKVVDRLPAKHELLEDSCGWCVYRETIEDVDHYEIIGAPDSPARWFEGPIGKAWPLSQESVWMKVDPESASWFGASPNHMTPVTTEHNFGGEDTSENPGPPDLAQGVEVFDTIDLRSKKLAIHTKIRAVWDEKRKKWVLNAIRGGGTGGLNTGGGVTDLQMCAIVGDIPACTWSVTKASSAISEIEKIPGVSEEECVIPMIESEDGSKYITDKWPEGHDLEGEPMIMIGENHCQEFPLRGGDAEEGTGESEGTFANGPIWGWGYWIEDRTGIEDEEEEGVYKFKVMMVENPCVIYEATLDSSLSSGMASVQVTPVADIWAKMPSGKRTAENLHEWDADNGATAQILRGYDRETILNVTGKCPEEE